MNKPYYTEYMFQYTDLILVKNTAEIILLLSFLPLLFKNAQISFEEKYYFTILLTNYLSPYHFKFSFHYIIKRLPKQCFAKPLLLIF